MLQSRTARWVTATALLSAVLLAIAWFLVVAPRRAAAADVQAQVAQEQQHNDVLRTDVEQLKAEFAELPLTRSKLADIRRQLPPDQDLPGLLRTMEGLATGSGVDLVSVSPGQLQPLGANGEVTTATSGGAAVLVALPLVIVINGDYFQAVSFVRQLQTGVSRAFLVNGLQIAKQDSGSAGGSQVAMTITGRVFSMPVSANAAAGAGQPAVAASAATPAATPGGTPVVTPAVTPAVTATPAATTTATPGAASPQPSSTAPIAMPALATGGQRW